MSNRFRNERSAASVVGLSGLLACLTLCVGCGGETPPEWTLSQRVRGQVVLASGEPVSQGKIVLTPRQGPKEPLTGWIDTDGSFTLMEDKGGKISHGTFSVHLEQLTFPPEIAKTPQGQALMAKLQRGQKIPAKYLKPETSGLTATILPETKEIPSFRLR